MELGLISHPAVVLSMLRLLWSINERLGGGDGFTCARPGLELVQDVLDIGEDRAERRENDDPD